MKKKSTPVCVTCPVSPERLICGVDEAGRGPLAGPVVAAAVILDPERPIDGLKDSKKLSHKKRTTLSDEIKKNALAWSIAEASVAEIDQLNILNATLLAMKRAIEALTPNAHYAEIDGNCSPALLIPSQAIIRGDSTHPHISAASILAKTYRDQLMSQFSQTYPEYGFEKHMGYGTLSHRQALLEFGPCTIHRRSFAPVAQAFLQRETKSHQNNRSLISLE